MHMYHWELQYSKASKIRKCVLCKIKVHAENMARGGFMTEPFMQPLIILLDMVTSNAGAVTTAKALHKALGRSRANKQGVIYGV